MNKTRRDCKRLAEDPKAAENWLISPVHSLLEQQCGNLLYDWKTNHCGRALWSYHCLLSKAEDDIFSLLKAHPLYFYSFKNNRFFTFSSTCMLPGPSLFHHPFKLIQECQLNILSCQLPKTVQEQWVIRSWRPPTPGHPLGSMHLDPHVWNISRRPATWTVSSSFSWQKAAPSLFSHQLSSNTNRNVQ